MKKLFLVLMVMVVIPFAGKAQTEKTFKNQDAEKTGQTSFSFGLNGGLDFDMNAYKLAGDNLGYYSYFNKSPRYNIGFDMVLKTSKKLRTRLEMKFVNVRYGISYDKSSYGISDNTLLNVNYFDFNFYFDCLWLTKGNFQLFVSPGLKYEYEIGHATLGPNYPITEFNHPSSIGAVALSFIGKYNLSKHFGITFIPEYTFFFHGFSTGNNKPYQRINTNLGVEYTF